MKSVPGSFLKIFTLFLLILIPTRVPAFPPVPPLPGEGEVTPEREGTPWDWLQMYEYLPVTAARKSFQAELENSPNDPRTLAGIAACLAIGIAFTWDDRVGTLERADELSRRAMEAEPGRVETQFARALVETLRFDFRSAELRSRKGLSLPGPIHLARMALGEALNRQGRWTEAEEVFRDGLREKPADCAASSGLSYALRQQGRYQEAVEVSAKAIQIFPDCYLARLAHTSAMHMGRRNRTALRGQRELLERFPESRHYTLLNSAAMVLTVGRYRSALEWYRQIEFGGGNLYYQLLRSYGESECYIQLGLQKEAVSGFRQLTRDFPPSEGGGYLRARILFPAYRSLSRILRTQGKRGEQILLLEEAGKEPDVPSRLLRSLGDLYADLGLHENAGEAYERAVRAGRFHDLHDEGETLIRWFRFLSRQAPGSTSFTGKIPPLREFERRVEREGDLATRYSLARVLALAGRPRESLNWLEKAIQAGYRNKETLRKDPDLESIRGRRRFEQLLDRIGKPEKTL